MKPLLTQLVPYPCADPGRRKGHLLRCPASAMQPCYFYFKTVTVDATS